jgi:hypothetical protein
MERAVGPRERNLEAKTGRERRRRYEEKDRGGQKVERIGRGASQGLEVRKQTKKK